MRYKVTFVAGLAIGYVLGAKAGTARYEQIARTARRIADSPTVQETAGVVGAQVSSAGKAVYGKVSEKIPVSSVKDFLSRPTEEEKAEMQNAGLNGTGPSGRS
jgi:hypothetical protein